MNKSIIALVLSLFACFFAGYVSYKVVSGSMSLQCDTEDEYVDSVATAAVQNMINPLFNSVEEVLVFRDLTAEGDLIDAQFNELPEEVLKNVAGVIIKREGHASKRSIVYEYRANKQVYDNLPASPVPETTNTSPQSSMEGNPVTKVDSTPAPAGETRYNQHDTVINGKTYKMKSKTEVTYE